MTILFLFTWRHDSKAVCNNMHFQCIVFCFKLHRTHFL